MKLSIGALYLCVYFTISAGDEELVTLEFGEHIGDLVGPFQGVSDEIELSGKYKFYGREETGLFISENGVISFREPFEYPFPQPLPLTSSSGTSVNPALIAGFWGDIDVPKNDGAIFYIEMNLPRTNGRFGRAKAKVLNLLYEGFGRSMEDFDPTHIFLITWEGVHETGEDIAKRAVTFQIAMVTNSIQTYVLLLYSDVRWNMSSGHGVTVGFNAGDGVRSFTHPLSNGGILNLDDETNSRSRGAFVYRVDGNTIVEPTAEQRSEHICVKRFLGTNKNPRFECTCPTAERPRLAFNQINCLYELLAVSFKDNSPIVSSDGVTAYVTANRPGVELYCQIMKVDRNRENCTSGVFERNNLLPGDYSIKVVALDHRTRERAILRGGFKILEESLREDDLEPCGVTIVDFGSALQSSNVDINFDGVGGSSEFLCRVVGRDRVPCESPFRVTGLTPGVHRVIVKPGGPRCSSREASSVRFRVV